jgi:hypothetical protein
MDLPNPMDLRNIIYYLNKKEDYQENLDAIDYHLFFEKVIIIIIILGDHYLIIIYLVMYHKIILIIKLYFIKLSLLD